MNAFFTALAVSLSIAFTGDILLDRGVRRAIEWKQRDTSGRPDTMLREGQKGWDAPWLVSRGLDSLFHVTDLVVGNLECPATRHREPQYKRFVFRAEPEWLALLRRHGFTHLSLANNHSIDQGRRGLMDTRQHIEAEGMTPLGADTTLAAAAQPVLLAREPRPIYALATLRLPLENFVPLNKRPSPNNEPLDSIVCRIRTIKQREPEAFVIVMPHWGVEHQPRPTRQQVAEAHRLVEAGADLIVGHHPHCVQTHELYQGRHIYYSLGNFIFDPRRQEDSKALVVRLTLDDQGAKVEEYNVEIVRTVPHLLPTEGAAGECTFHSSFHTSEAPSNVRL